MPRGWLYETRGDDGFDADAAADADVVAFHPDGRLSPLFLLRTWSEELELHRNLTAHLGAEQPLFSVAPPRAAAKDDYPTTLGDWRDFMLERVERIPHSSPYLLGGWSFGGVIGVDVAEALAARGRPIQLVVMLDSRAPGTWVIPPRRRVRRRKLTKIARHLLRYSQLDTGAERRAFIAWRARRRVQKLQRKLAKLAGRGGRRPQAGMEHPEEQVFVSRRGKSMSYLKRAIQISYTRYTPFVTHAPVAQLWTRASLERCDLDATLGWSRYLHGEIQVAGCPGDHWSMLQEPHVGTTAARLARVLRRAQDDGHPYLGEPGPISVERPGSGAGDPAPTR